MRQILRRLRPPPLYFQASFRHDSGMTISLISLIESAHARYTEYFAEAVSRAKSENPDVVSEFLIPLSDDSIPFPYRHFRADLMGEDEDDNTRAVELWQDPPSDDAAAEAHAYSFNLGTVTVDVHPFTWCAAQISFNHQLSDESLIADYLEEWMDPQDRAYDNGELYAYAIHFATQIQQVSAWDERNTGAYDEEEDDENDGGLGNAASAPLGRANRANPKKPRTLGRSTDLYAAEASALNEEEPPISTLTLDFGTAPAETLFDLIERLTHDGATHITIKSETRGKDE